MESSDDESQVLPEAVTTYYFVDEKEEPISFAVLPVQWSDSDDLKSTEKRVFLHGTADNGLQKIYKQITAWKLELSDEQPSISVLTKEKNWIKLLKPRKVFEETIRSILITVHCIHFANKNPEATDTTMWDNLRKIFSSYDEQPSENDLASHLPFVKEMVEKNDALAKSKVLNSLLEGKLMKRKAPDEDVQTGSDAKKSKFIVDDEEEEMNAGLGGGESDESDEEPDLFDSVCAICDNGGELLCCEGRCLRSFHATKADGADSDCKSLGYTKAEVKAIQNFLCANCKLKQHQCFACGKLGSSDKSSGAEVFPCVSATCGHFYHPECVVKLLYPDNDAEAEELQKKIAAGESFTCPVHKCLVCKQGENKENEETQFAMCRRCPRAYHRKCLPRRIAFEDDSEDEDIQQRAWEDLIPNRILIYCLKHRIDEDLGTPIRNHIKFPEIAQKKEFSRERVIATKKTVTKESSREKTVVRLAKKNEGSSAGKESDSLKRSAKLIPIKGSDSAKKPKALDPLKKPLKDSAKAVLVKEEKTPNSVPSKGAAAVKSRTNFISGGKIEKAVTPSSFTEKPSPRPVIDSEGEKKILALIKKVTSSLTHEDVVNKYKFPSIYSQSSRHLDKAITLGKVEGSVEAAKTALQKLEDGGSIEDAKAVCEPQMLNQLSKWKSKLGVYLSPFLYGMRYTSFGRHFTKVDKLKEIVNKLHWYVQPGDTIVDFCCGANDFSRLTKEKLEETGKICSFKNFDLIQPKNDFNFEKRDWMSVMPSELPTGSELIMGLNPPFGVKAALANKFIDKALQFKPKLVILIVPAETERLDRKKEPYDLVWEDDELLSGKSFYLPGSVDINDKQMEQWNVKPPPLYLWSRPDWTSKHKAIAVKKGHLSRERAGTIVEEIHEEDLPRPENNSFFAGLEQQKNAQEGSEETKQAEELKEITPPPKFDSWASRNKNEGGNKREESHENGKKKSTLKKERKDKGKQGKKQDEASGDDQNDWLRQTDLLGKESSPKSMSISPSPPIRNDSSRTVSEKFQFMSEKAGSEDGYRGSQLGQKPQLVSGSEFGAGYKGSQQEVSIDDIERRYGLKRDDTFARGWQVSGSGSGGLEQAGSLGLEPRFSGYLKENEPESFRRSYLDEIDAKYGPLGGGLDATHRLYGRQGGDDLSQRSSYLFGSQDSTRSGALGTHSSTLGLSGVGLESSFERMSPSASTLQRYAPRLDDTNFARPSVFGSDSLLASRSSIFDPAAPRSSFQSDSLGFASGPQRPYSYQSSSGWLNE